MVTIALPGNLLDLLDGPEPSTEPAEIETAAEPINELDNAATEEAPFDVADESLGEMVSAAAAEIVENVDQIVSAVVPEMETDAGATIIPIGDNTEGDEIVAQGEHAPDCPPLPTEPPPVTANDRFLREKRDFEEQIASLSVEIAQHKAQAKALKQQLDDTIEQYEEHIAQGTSRDTEYQTPTPEVALKKLSAKVAAADVVSTSNDNAAADSAIATDHHTAPPANPDAWRLTPTSELDFDSIKGMGKKKIEALLERCPTMGDLTDLVEKNEFGKGLTTIKGIGGVLASDIENAMSDWLTKNRDAEILGFAGMTAQEQVELTKQQDATASADVVSNQTTATAAASPAQQSPAHPADAIQARFDDLAGSKDENRFDPQHDMDAWTAGQNSYIAGAHFRQCPLPAGPRQDDWLRGWLAEQEAESGVESGDVVSDEDEQDYENSTGEDGEYFDEDEDGE